MTNEKVPNIKSLDKDIWADLVCKAQEGDQLAFNQLMAELYPFVRSIIMRKTGNIIDSDDITQECLLGVYRTMSTFDPKKPFRPWLISIVRFKTCDYFRKLAKRELELLKEDMSDVTDSSLETNILEREEEKEKILEVIEQLPAKLKQAIVLTKLQGLSYNEASNKEGISEAALRKRISRAYKLISKSANQFLEI